MELRDLKAFVTLGEVLHFGQAAARQHIAGFYCLAQTHIVACYAVVLGAHRRPGAGATACSMCVWVPM